MSKQASKQTSERVEEQKRVTDVVCERVLGEKDGSLKTDFEHSLHHSAECKSTLTRGA